MTDQREGAGTEPMRVELKAVAADFLTMRTPSEWVDVLDRFGPPDLLLDGRVDDARSLEAAWGTTPDLIVYGSRAVGYAVKIAETSRAGPAVLQGVTPDTRLERYLDRCASQNEGEASQDLDACRSYYTFVSQMLLLCAKVPAG